MHVTWPLLASLYHLGRWDEMFPIVDEHMTAYALEPAAECLLLRDGPLIAVSALAHMGEMDQARLAGRHPRRSRGPSGYRKRLAGRVSGSQR